MRTRIILLGAVFIGNTVLEVGVERKVFAGGDGLAKVCTGARCLLGGDPHSKGLQALHWYKANVIRLVNTEGKKKNNNPQ